MNAAVDQRAMMELYAAPFRAAVRSGVGSFMCSYNRVNGAHACESAELLQALKGQIGFRGWVMSDWKATHSTAGSVNAGMDQEMPFGKFFSPSALKDYISSGKVCTGPLGGGGGRGVGRVSADSALQWTAAFRK